MKIQIEERKGADERHFPQKYVAIGCESVRYVSACCELRCNDGCAHGGLHQRGMHQSKRNDCAKTKNRKHVMRGMTFVNGHKRENAD
jgi:hypothetical protein|uniref:Uncharacterized protein n=1 Tax=viral metagenome TaxID=1070528 RepID=A0A6C0M0P3_9ZZZZ